MGPQTFFQFIVKLLNKPVSGFTSELYIGVVFIVLFLLEDRFLGHLRMFI